MNDVGGDIIIGFFVLLIGAILYSMYTATGGVDAIIAYITIVVVMLLGIVLCAAVGYLIRKLIGFFWG